MNMEILTAEVKTNKTSIFSFSHPIIQYMIGFSTFGIKYDGTDHHVKEISIDLSNSHKANNEVIVTPKLMLRDTTGHIRSTQSSITIVVLATIGYGSPNIYMLSLAKMDTDFSLPLKAPLFMKAAIVKSSVQFPSLDHHLNKYYSNIESESELHTFKLNGESCLQDNGRNNAKGQLLGSVIISNQIDRKIFCADFSSKNIGNTGYVSLGELPPKYDIDDYQFGIFVNSYQLSFTNPKEDHHIHKIEVSAEIIDKSIIHDFVCLKLNLKSFWTDKANKKPHQTSIPNNSVSGFVVGFSNKIYKN